MKLKNIIYYKLAIQIKNIKTLGKVRIEFSHVLTVKCEGMINVFHSEANFEVLTPEELAPD